MTAAAGSPGPVPGCAGNTPPHRPQALLPPARQRRRQPRRGRRRPGGEDGDSPAAARRLSPCVWSTKTESVSEHLWSFKTLLYNSVICKSCQQAQATLIQTHAKWQKFSDKELMPTGISSARERGHPHPLQRTHANRHKFCSDPCNHSPIQRDAEGRRRWRRRQTAVKEKYLLASSGHGCREVLGGEDGDGSAARTATARRLGGFPLRAKHQNGVSFGTPLEFQNLIASYIDPISSKPRPYGWSSLI